ncbi:MAG: c-type cytochrome biogenesis protein CcsB [Deltaproteobacteria bacterium]|nr:c-type cytochrome biogenesis protein CcsB [Deltaproteobacteria bacterium]
MNTIFFYISLVFYSLATIFYLSYLIVFKKIYIKIGFYLLLTGFLCHSLALGFRIAEAGYFPVTNLHESLSFFPWAIIFVYILYNLKNPIPILGIFVTPLAFSSMFIASLFPNIIKPLPPILKSIWLPIHVVFAFLGNAVFALAFCGGILYLIQERALKNKRVKGIYKIFPSLESLDAINYRCLTIGFPLLTIGIITGSIWASYAWGSYWQWDPKETWSLITWFIYAILLHERLTVGWRGKRAAIMAIFGFLVIIFTFLGVNLVLYGLHSYNSW